MVKPTTLELVDKDTTTCQDQETVARMWHILTDGLQYGDTGKYDKWLEDKGYCTRTVKAYDLMMRRVGEEGLTIDSVDIIYKDYSRYTKIALKHAIRMVEEYHAEMD